MKELVENTIDLLLMKSFLEDNELLKILVENNVAEHLANDLIIFIPIAWARIILSEMGLKLPDGYFRTVSNNEETYNKFSDSEIFKIATQLFWENNYGVENLKLIAERSPEYKSVNNLLLNGSKGEDLSLSEISIM